MIDYLNSGSISSSMTLSMELRGLTIHPETGRLHLMYVNHLTQIQNTWSKGKQKASRCTEKPLVDVPSNSGYPSVLQQDRKLEFCVLCWKFSLGYWTVVEADGFKFSQYNMISYTCLSLIMWKYYLSETEYAFYQEHINYKCLTKESCSYKEIWGIMRGNYFWVEESFGSALK